MGAPKQERSFDGHRILVAEDELLLAMEIKGFLEDRGCSVLGPVPSVSRALALFEAQVPDAAILDLNLKGELATPVAANLAALAVPFVLLTGYGAADPRGLGHVREAWRRDVPELDREGIPRHRSTWR